MILIDDATIKLRFDMFILEYRWGHLIILEVLNKRIGSWIALLKSNVVVVPEGWRDDTDTSLV